jgi:hypothetical protein
MDVIYGAKPLFGELLVDTYYVVKWVICKGE